MEAVRRAGDVVGTPEWQLDLMYENESDRLWEKLNAPDPYEKEMKEAAIDIWDAADKLDSAEEELSAAFADLYDTPLRDSISDYMEKISDIRYELYDLAKKYERGER